MLTEITTEITSKKRSRKFEEAFTLLEIMIVVAIIGLLAGSVSFVAFNKWKKAQVTQTKEVIMTVKNALQEFTMDTNEQCPGELKDLKTKKYLTKEPKDAWGQDLVFKCPGEQDKDSADVSSPGPDKKEGTEDDINSWDI